LCLVCLFLLGGGLTLTGQFSGETVQRFKIKAAVVLRMLIGTATLILILFAYDDPLPAEFIFMLSLIIRSDNDESIILL